LTAVNAFGSNSNTLTLKVVANIPPVAQNSGPYQTQVGQTISCNLNYSHPQEA